MIPLIKYKRIVRKIAGWAQVTSYSFSQSRSARRSCIFYYHRIADVGRVNPYVDDRNVSPELFERHIAALTDFAEIVPLQDLPEKLSQRQLPNTKPLVSLTFDDGYANFWSNALPILKRYQVPVTMSVVTGYVGSRTPPPFDDWVRVNGSTAPAETWRLMNWRELEDCVATGLVTLGAHSHSHLKGNDCTPTQLQEEVGLSAEILRHRFGDQHGQVYAYPFGNSLLGNVSKDYEKAVRDAGFVMGVTTDVGLVVPESNPFCLPRIEAHGQDSAYTLRAKSAGAFGPLHLNAWFHKIQARKVNRGERWVSATPTIEENRP